MAKAANTALADDAKTYESRCCPHCGRTVKVRTYVRATDRAGLEKYPKHNGNDGWQCEASGMTMRQAREAFGNGRQ